MEMEKMRDKTKERNTRGWKRTIIRKRRKRWSIREARR